MKKLLSIIIITLFPCSLLLGEDLKPTKTLVLGDGHIHIKGNEVTITENFHSRDIYVFEKFEFEQKVGNHNAMPYKAEIVCEIYKVEKRKFTTYEKSGNMDVKYCHIKDVKTDNIEITKKDFVATFQGQDDISFKTKGIVVFKPNRNAKLETYYTFRINKDEWVKKVGPEEFSHGNNFKIIMKSSRIEKTIYHPTDDLMYQRPVNGFLIITVDATITKVEKIKPEPEI